MTLGASGAAHFTSWTHARRGRGQRWEWDPYVVAALRDRLLTAPFSDEIVVLLTLANSTNMAGQLLPCHLVHRTLLLGANGTAAENR